jgi:hypothetical protein
MAWDFALLRNVMCHPTVNVLKTIPAGSRRQVATCASALIHDIVSRPNDEQGYVRFFLFPRAVLRNMPWEELSKLRRKRRKAAQQRFTLRCLNDWNEGGASRDHLILDALDQPLPKHRRGGTIESNLRRCERIAREDGQYGKALKSLGSNGMAPFGAETTQVLRDQHPRGRPVQILNILPDGHEVLSEDIMTQLRSFAKGTSSGRSGWSVTHLLECSYHQTAVPAFLENLTALVNLFLSGRASPAFATFMSSAALVPLLKKDGVSIRPVAVGEVLRRLISKCCVKAVTSKAIAHLKPLQLGVGIPNGAEAILHGLNRLIRDRDPPWDSVMALVDFRNAFNMVDRQCMLEEVHRMFPRIFAWVQYTYGVGATLFSGSDTIEATAGVQQGDPLGPLLFSLVLQPLLVRMKSDFALTTVSYLDDVTLHGPAERVSEALSWLSFAGPDSGLHISASKTVIWSPVGSLQPLRDRGMFGEYHCSLEPGVELLGGAVSESPEFIQRVVDKRVDKCIESLHRMMALEDPQLCLLLLRACEGMPKLMYCWRTVCPDYLQEPSERFEKELIDALRKITVLDGPHFGAFQVSLSTLPVSLGGLGIQLPSDILNFAFVASAIASDGLQQGILGLEASEYPPWVPAMAQAYSEKVFIHDPAQADELSQLVLLPQHQLQLFMARTYYESRRAKLMDHPYIIQRDQETRRRFEGVLASFVRKDASCWLFALPNAGLGQRMTPLEFQAAMSFRLLMPQFESGSMCCQKSCVAALDVFGYHALVCRGHFLPRHNLVRDALFDLTLKARFAPQKDAPVTCLGFRSGQAAAFRPADLLVAGDDFDQDCVDVTVVSPLVTNNQPEVVVGKKAEEAEKKKYQKHQEACENAGFGFKAFAMDVFGVLAEQSLKFLKRVCSKLMREADYPKYMASAICYRRISFSVQLGVARQFLACREPGGM